jgi:hypothetical protein
MGHIWSRRGDPCSSFAPATSTARPNHDDRPHPPPRSGLPRGDLAKRRAIGRIGPATRLIGNADRSCDVEARPQTLAACPSPPRGRILCRRGRPHRRTLGAIGTAATAPPSGSSIARAVAQAVDYLIGLGNLEVSQLSQALKELIALRFRCTERSDKNTVAGAVR